MKPGLAVCSILDRLTGCVLSFSAYLTVSTLLTGHVNVQLLVGRCDFRSMAIVDVPGPSVRSVWQGPVTLLGHPVLILCPTRPAWMVLVFVGDLGNTVLLFPPKNCHT